MAHQKSTGRVACSEIHHKTTRFASNRCKEYYEMLFQADDRVPKITEPKFGAMTTGVKSVSRYELRKCTSDSGTGASSLGNEFLYISLVPQKLSDRFLFLNFQISIFLQKNPPAIFSPVKRTFAPLRTSMRFSLRGSNKARYGFWFVFSIFFYARAHPAL